MNYLDSNSKKTMILKHVYMDFSNNQDTTEKIFFYKDFSHLSTNFEGVKVSPKRNIETGDVFYVVKTKEEDRYIVSNLTV